MEWTERFLVDTGAYDCMAPAKELKKLKLKPRGKRSYELADGTQVDLSVCAAEIEFLGEIVGVTMIFGADDVEPILGVTALESAGFEVDPQTQRLKKLPAVSLKRMKPRR
jgi:clan AA aspartic protease